MLFAGILLIASIPVLDAIGVSGPALVLAFPIQIVGGTLALLRGMRQRGSERRLLRAALRPAAVAGRTPPTLGRT